MSDAVDVVQTFLDLLASKRSEEAVTLLTPDTEWRNTGLPTLRGARVIDTLLLLERRGIHFSADMHHIAADGDAVLTERTDHLGIGRWSASFWVCGTFELREGRIALWGDHFAAANVLVGSVKGLGQLLGRRRG